MVAQEPGEPASGEVGPLLARLALVVLLAAACVALPLTAAALVSPWVGVTVAFPAFRVWRNLGPPPAPGFLSGILCLCGFAAILGALLACLVLGMRSL
jgi:hypothetical protein